MSVYPPRPKGEITPAEARKAYSRKLNAMRGYDADTFTVSDRNRRMLWEWATLVEMVEGDFSLVDDLFSFGIEPPK